MYPLAKPSPLSLYFSLVLNSHNPFVLTGGNIEEAYKKYISEMSEIYKEIRNSVMGMDIRDEQAIQSATASLFIQFNKDRPAVKDFLNNLRATQSSSNVTVDSHYSTKVWQHHFKKEIEQHGDRVRQYLNKVLLQDNVIDIDVIEDKIQEYINRIKK